MALSATHNHYDTFREELAKAYPGFGHALWEPDPGEDPPVEVGDVGFIRDGRFHRLFNALLPGDHKSHERFGVPEYHEPLLPVVTNHINRGALSPNTFYSSGVTVVSGGFGVLAATTIGSADVSFSFTRKQGAVLSLPVTAQREDTVTRDHFREWIAKHIESWFAFTQRLRLGVQMEDIVLVTGCHRTRSWSNITFNEVQAGAQLSLGVDVAGTLGASINWRASSLRIQGAVLSQGPSGENLPENQCIFIRGFRMKRILFGTIPRIRGAAEPKPDPRGNDSDCEPEKEVVSIPNDTEYRDPLHILLEYIAKLAPDCDMALVHDDDLERILGIGDSNSLENLQPDVVMDYLERSKPEIESVSHYLRANDTIPRTNMEHMTVAMLSAQPNGLDHPSSASFLPYISVGITNKQTINEDATEQLALAKATQIKSLTQAIQQTVKNMNLTQLRASLRKWQSPPDPSANHIIACDRQHEGSATWLFQGPLYTQWKVTGSLLWIHGRPGSGKSVLCSAIINDISAMCEAGVASLGYFYFDMRNLDKISCRSLLSSLLTQLTSRSNPFCDILSRLYKAHDEGARQPSDRALTQCLKEMLALPGQAPVYLIMDALDECPNEDGIPSTREHVLDLIKDLIDLHLPSLHLCVTSRLEFDVKTSLLPLASYDFSLHDQSGQQHDISKYVRAVVYAGGCMRRWRDDEKELIIETLSEKADGIFRWAFCQLEALRHCLPPNIRRFLADLPQSLDETYARVLMEIGGVNWSQARRLFQCLAVASRPLRVEELAEFIALDFDGARGRIPSLNKNWRWNDQERAILSACSSLIVIVVIDGSRVVQFAHFSVKEFLTSDRLASSHEDVSFFHISLPPAHTTIAQACLGILLQLDDGLNNYSPLADYAARHWVDHAQLGDVSFRVEDGMQRLFDPSKPHFAAWLQLHDVDNGWDQFKHYSITEPRGTPLYYASLCGFRDLASDLIAEHPQYVNTGGGLNHSSLVAALHKRHFDIAELLFQHGAALDVRGYQRQTPLHAASADGLADVVKWLLSHGADASSVQDGLSTPLNMAAANGHLEVIQTLLEHGVDPDTANDDDHTPLHLASENGHFKTARLLLEHGANIYASDWSQSTPLHLASFGPSAETVQLLIQFGANVHAQNESHLTPLHLASSGGQIETVLLLIEYGADVNARDENNSTPLHLASSAGLAEIAQLLIEHGADIDSKDDVDQTPFQVALSGGHPDQKIVAKLPSAPESPPRTPSPQQGMAPEPSMSKRYLLAALPGDAVKKRPRGRYDEIERIYNCSWTGCTKSYGTLNHLNAHIVMERHGTKRTPAEFQELRRLWRKANRDETERLARPDSSARPRGHSTLSRSSDGEIRDTENEGLEWRVQKS